MQINITGKNIDVTASIRDHIETKFQKLEKWQVNIISCQATISTEPGNIQKIEATISVPKANLVATASHEDLYKAINEIEQKLERQLNKLSHKHEAKRAKNNKPEILEEEAE